MSDRLLAYIAFIFILRHVQGMVNAAYNKLANQSTTLNYNHFAWTADKAVDGNSDGSFPDNSQTCSATAVSSASVNHTWEVDIGSQIIVRTITVCGRTDKEKNQLDGFTVYLGNTSEQWKYSQGLRSGPAIVTQYSKYVFQVNNTIARYITLVRYNTILTICEVIVEKDCTPGTYGSGCTEICGHCINGDSRCSTTDGFCMDGCEAGWRDGTCKLNCTPGTYGSGCTETCGHCYNGDTRCSPTDGICIEGCEAGWRGVTCKFNCAPGTYGKGCIETCGNCMNGNSRCSLTNGRCMDGCQAGWSGDICKFNCAPGTYGSGCTETCGHCYNGDTRCSPTDGQCKDGCVAGWRNETCKLKCDRGTYGYNCNETCGMCLYGNASCSTSNGSCRSGCDAGWQGDNCKKICYIGIYGNNCPETCGKCLYGNRSCSILNGSCINGCDAGWQGDGCKQGCEGGTYGYNCNETCGYCLHGNISCSPLNGSCSSGCNAGWHSDDCKKVVAGPNVDAGQNVGAGPNVGAIVGSTLAAVGVSIFAVVIITVIVKRRKRNNNETGTEMTNATNYANLVVESPDANCKVTVYSTAKTATSNSACQDTTSIRIGPDGAIHNHRGVMQPDVHINNDYEKLHDRTESAELAYSSIDQAFTHQQEMKSLENCSSYMQSLQSLEGALISVEEEINLVLSKKEKLLSRELERARGNKILDKRMVKDSTFPDKDKDFTIHNYVQTLQSLEEELRNLEEKKKCLLDRKEILLRQELAKTTESRK